MTNNSTYTNSYLTQQTQLYIRNASIRRVKSTGKLGISYKRLDVTNCFTKLLSILKPTMDLKLT